MDARHSTAILDRPAILKIVTYQADHLLGSLWITHYLLGRLSMVLSIRFPRAIRPPWTSVDSYGQVGHVKPYR